MVCIQLACLLLVVSCAFAIEIKSIEWTKHHDNTEVYEILLAVHKRCPTITNLYHLKYKDAKGVERETTPMKNKLHVLQFGKSKPGRPQFKWVGNMHGNEVVGRELLLRMAVTLCIGYASGSGMWYDLVSSTEVHILFSMNPDGWQIASNSSLPGSRSVVKGRRNARNVDLNRNFPDLDKKVFELERVGGPYDHLLRNYTDRCDRQPETCMVIAWILANNFVLSANLHGGDKVANYPYDEARHSTMHEYARCPDDRLFRQLALAYASGNSAMSNRPSACEGGPNQFADGITNGAQWYSVSSGMQDFNYLASNCFEITVELGCQKYPPGRLLPRYWHENRLSFAQYTSAVHYGIKGSVTSNGRIVGNDAVIAVEAIGPGGEQWPILHNVNTGKDGHYYRLLRDGIYAVTARHPGCAPVTKCVVVDNAKNVARNSAAWLDFELTTGTRKAAVIDDSCYYMREYIEEMKAAY